MSIVDGGAAALRISRVAASISSVYCNRNAVGACEYGLCAAVCFDRRVVSLHVLQYYMLRSKKHGGLKLLYFVPCQLAGLDVAAFMLQQLLGE